MKKYASFFALFFIGVMLVAPSVSLALDCPSRSTVSGDTKWGPCELPDRSDLRVNLLVDLVETITNWLFTGLLLLAVLMMIIAAYHYLFSGGSEEGTQKGKNYIVYTVIALAVAMLSKGITYVVFELVG